MKTAWALWDCGSAAFNAVLVTFIFSVYLTDSVGANIDASQTPSFYYSIALAIAGVAIALVAPVMGQRADARGTRRKSLILWTLVTIGLMASLFLARNDAALWFWVGITIMAVASITFEFAEVNYFAMLNQISTPATVGRISGVGWALGYVGGIVVLLLCFILFISGEGGAFGLPTEAGLNIRLVALFAAAWFLLAALPLFFKAPPAPKTGEQLSWAGSYKKLWATIRHLWISDRNTAYFLIASAVFRDGLAGVFTYGAILAVAVYGLDNSDVLLFGVAANVVAAAGAAAGGWLDDRIGPKPVIMGSLVAMIVVAGVLLFGEGPTIFWIFGLLLCLFVGPAQSASRSFLARLTDEQHSGEIFGLYATTGRAVSWLAPLMFMIFTAIGGDRLGIVGIAVVLAAGAFLLVPVKQEKVSTASA
ncbi:major facilitator superfamily permease [Corynebacterium renale]|nr:MFS transporter [Corynebacterium renale]SQG63663.1 major facilitator superfamily permease [Corynebacterium renale]STD01443.1 major facilitator superfamily permease [Corynebacterium renale]